MHHRQRTILLSSALLVATMISVAIFPSCSHQRPLKERFQAQLDSLHLHYRFPGATAAYVLPDGTVEDFAVGLADIEQEKPMTPQSRMLAASIGKTFVGATLLALAADGLLSLDDPVSKWLGDQPWFGRLPNHESITLRQLLNHTSGIPNHVESEQFALAFSERWQLVDNPFSREELIGFVLDQPPLFPAGEAWYYSDTGYLLLGLVIERATGYRWYDEVVRRFLQPLNLSRTTSSDRVDLPGLAAGYMVEENSFGLPPKTTSAPGRMVWNPGIEWSGGGFVSNSKDLAVWGKMLYEGRAMEGNYLDDLLASVPVADTDSGTSYGLAVAVHTGGPFGPTYGHGGWIPGYISSLRYYPEYDICIAFQINTDIGIVDHSEPVVEDMEERLAEIVVAAARQDKSGD
ncbi:beta-lactamase family protein [bacterium]|nr:beta-lactamase family protein [bacterium]